MNENFAIESRKFIQNRVIKLAQWPIVHSMFCNSSVILLGGFG